MVAYRPWGPLRALLAKLPGSSYDVVCSLNPGEDRSLAAATLLSGLDRASTIRSVYVVPPAPTDRYLATADAMKRAVVDLRISHIPCEIPLLANLQSIGQLEEDLLHGVGDDIILDISSLPKRFAFHLLRRLRERNPRTLIVTMTAASRYAEGHLRMDPLPARPLPGYEFPGEFGGLEPEICVIAIGREALGLYRMLDERALRGEMQFLVPFPSASPGYQDGIDFLADFGNWRNTAVESHVGVFAPDVPSIFDQLAAITAGGTRRCTLVPFGPKTVSLAMCLFAGSPSFPEMSDVVYTQPQHYAERYSFGVGADPPPDGVRGYCVVIDGRDLY